MKVKKLREIEDKIADLKGRWSAHSVLASMWLQSEELEGELEEAKKEGGGDGAAESGSRGL